MSPVPHGRSRVALHFLCLVMWLSCCPVVLSLPQNDEQAAIRRLVENYFAAYQKKDLEGLMSLWSVKSPDVATTRQSLQQTFAGVEKIAVSIIKIGKATIAADKAKLMIEIEINAVELKTGRPAPERLHRTLSLIREGGEWKVWSLAASEEELAEAIVGAETDEKRRALLVAGKELMTVELQKALVRQGQLLFDRGDYGQSVMIYKLSLELAGQLNYQAGAADALRGIGSVHFFQGNYAEALDYYQKSLKLAEGLGYKALLARIQRNLGNIYISQFNYPLALDYYRKGLKLSEELGDKAGVSTCLSNIGSIYSEQGNYTQALNYYQQSLRLSEEIGDKASLIVALNNIGVIHRLQGNYAEALSYCQQSLRLAEELGSKARILRAVGNVGRVYSLQGSYAQALEYYQKSLKLAEAIGSKEGITLALTDIGDLYITQGNYSLALDYYQRGLKLADELGDKSTIAYALGNIGSIYTEQGSYVQASAYYRQSLKLAEESGDKAGIVSSLNNIGYTYVLQGDYTQALDYYQQGLKLAEKLGDKAAIAKTLNNIGAVYESQGSYTKAVEMADRAAAIANQIGMPALFQQARATAGKAYRALNQPGQARQAFVDAISTIEKLRSQVAGGEEEQQRFFENKLVAYYQMVDLLVTERDEAAALAYAERAKGRVLLDVLRSGRANITLAMTTEEQARERRLNSELVSLNSQLYRENFRPQPDAARVLELNTRLQRTRLEYESFQTSLYGAHPELKVRRGETMPLALSEAAQLLRPDGNTALLEYSVADDNSYLFVLTRQAAKSSGETPQVTLKVYPLAVKGKELSDMVETFQKQLSERNLAFTLLAERLYQLLLKPAEEQLRGKGTLCIVPDGMLWQLPFQALKPTATRYLIEDYALFYAPSLTTLREMLKPGKRSRAARPLRAPTLLAFGNPSVAPGTITSQRAVYRDGDLGSLPEAEKEVNALRQLYGAARSRIYIGDAAREERVKAEMGAYRIVHFATHGILDNRSPLYSHLLLAQAPGNSGEDGLLEAREIMDMDLQAELVVLSACQTAGGRVGAGEGVIGMTWALFVAGCPATLVSQWKVDTRSTSRLMVEFHTNLQRQRQGPSVVRKAEALRQAMLTLLRSEEYELPYYWAPFVLIGNGF
jgi:CHAT domain-containing protein/ketosteroid isomerase-like protein